jgi:hypothetical protein
MEKEKEEKMMGKYWNKITVPLVSQEATETGHTASKQRPLSLLLQKETDDQAARSFLLQVVQP